MLTDPEQSKQQKQKRKENKVPGPVELFFNSITKAGGEMVSTSRAYFKGEVAYDIMEGPANWVRPWLRGVARRAALARAEGRRPSLTGASNADFDMNARLLAKLTADQQRDLAMIQSGGLWTAHSLKKAGYLTCDVCPWCGIEPETLDHLWWRCPAHEHHREEVRKLLQQSWTELPSSLALHGIPTESTVLHGSKSWLCSNAKATDEGQWNQEPTELQGDQKIAWNQVHAELTHQLTARGLQQEAITTRQLVQWMHGDYQPMPTWTHTRCQQHAPTQVTAYPDGAVDHGTTNWMGRGTWGLYTTDSDQTMAELQDVATTQRHLNGWMAYGATAGPALSSTRQEAIALYAGLSLQGPQHFGVDNAAVVKIYDRMLSKRTRNQKPWGLVDDGDLWGAIEEATIARGWDSNAISKVKGHAKEEDIAKGHTTKEHKEGNESADIGTNKAKREYNNHHAHILSMLDKILENNSNSLNTYK